MSWQNHPWVVALGAGGATAIFCITLFMTVVVPTWTKSEDNRIVDLERNLSDIRGDRDSKIEAIKKLNETVQKQDSINKQLSNELLNSELTPMFPDSDPYPKTLRKIRIGDSVAQVLTEFGAAAKDGKKGGWVSVDLRNSPFSSLAYYKDSNDKIDSILFLTKDLSYENKIDFNEIARNQLIESFGKPDATADEDGGKVKYCWRRKKLDFSIYPAGLDISNASDGKLTCSP